ncbi:MAG: hypothetical protein S4CHLAM123_09910 [Chlamydiales bacterium]|nr:hypothetical protein [Chlamydiales bacterium]
MNGTLSENDFQEILERKKEMEGGSVQPLPLQRVILPPNPFPFEALGPILGLAAQRIHEVIQTSDAIAAQSVLSAAAFATQSFADIHIDGRVYPLSLFLLTVAESGDRKSAADRIAVKPIYEYEQMLAQRYRKEKESYQIHREAWGQQKQAILQEGGERLHKSLLKHQETLSLPP